MTQYNCDYSNLAPQGCLQYFFGQTTGTVRSFNYAGSPPFHLANQKQSICVRFDWELLRWYNQKFWNHWSISPTFNEQLLEQFSCTKKLQSHTVRKEKLQKILSYGTACKMFVKLTPCCHVFISDAKRESVKSVGRLLMWKISNCQVEKLCLNLNVFY